MNIVKKKNTLLLTDASGVTRMMTFSENIYAYSTKNESTAYVLLDQKADFKLGNDVFLIDTVNAKIIWQLEKIMVPDILGGGADRAMSVTQIRNFEGKNVVVDASGLGYPFDPTTGKVEKKPLPDLFR